MKPKKRAKKAIVEVGYTRVKTYTVTCPHCKTELRGYDLERVLMFSCWHCDNPIDIREKE